VKRCCAFSGFLASKSDLNITERLAWFFACPSRAFDGAQSILAGVLNKARLRRSTLAIRATMASAICSTGF
jgi:hypothetical protein